MPSPYFGEEWRVRNMDAEDICQGAGWAVHTELINPVEEEDQMSFATRYAKLRAPLGIAAALGLSLSVALPSIVYAQATQAPKPAAPAGRPAARPAAPAQAPADNTAPTGGPTVVQVKGAPDVPDWQKQCGKDEASSADVCVTAREFVSDNGQPVLAVAIYDVKIGTQPSNRSVRILMPFGLNLETGVRFSVDRSGYVPGRFQVCLPNGCFAEVPIKDDVLANMRKGTTFNVAVRNSAGAEVVFAIPAGGFAKAFDGAAVDPKELEAHQKRMQEELERRSEEMRKQLEKAGPEGTPSIAPSTPPAAGAK